MIDLDFTLPLADFFLTVRATLQSPVTALVGKSGSGKTSILETIAGLRRVVSGRIEVAGETLLDSRTGVFLPPERRSIGYVPQEGALFPHMTARENLLFCRHPRRRSTLDFDHVVEALSIGELLDRYPSRLSGGERQRVALGRAILSGPRLLLLDEPLAALDHPLRERVLTYLRRIRELVAIPVLYVTHQPIEALAMSDEVIVLERGKVLAQGPSSELLSRPELLGQAAPENLLLVDSPIHDAARGWSRVTTSEGMPVYLPYDQVEGATFPLMVQVSSDEIMTFLERPVGISARNVLEGKVRELKLHDGIADFTVATPSPLHVRITRDAADDLELQEGRPVWIAIRTRALRLIG